MTLSVVATFLATGLAGLLMVAAPPSSLHAPVDAHVDARDHPTPAQGRAAFAAMEQALVRGFDDICGDTFCEGDFSNLRALQLRCAVVHHSGALSSCLWSFAGSHASVGSGDEGLPVVEARVWACPLPVVAGTPLPLLLATLQGREALDTPLPGTGTSAYDALVDCL